ncbi:MAG: hypothetical protein FWG88_04345 [Oscillospiraceae bacterium]|nr:hypothetical protein [Oscillospiraceae bacterium]
MTTKALAVKTGKKAGNLVNAIRSEIQEYHGIYNDMTADEKFEFYRDREMGNNIFRYLHVHKNRQEQAQDDNLYAHSA